MGLAGRRETANLKKTQEEEQEAYPGGEGTAALSSSLTDDEIYTRLKRYNKRGIVMHSGGMSTCQKQM